MRPADRLFRLLLELRRRRVVTARQLAERLEVSERTIYRDIASLQASGVPIVGEAGVGYQLAHFELPPLMFDREEIEALVLGARVVEAWGDAELGQAAARVLAKIEAILPRDRSNLIEETRLYAPIHGERPVEKLPLSNLRRAINRRLRLTIVYRDEKGQETRRSVRPLALVFYPPTWLLLAWCELRHDFRSFRVDRVFELLIDSTAFTLEPGQTLPDFLAKMAAEEEGCDATTQP
jgi:predicted DNA-binding transcriptional regulator YafY